jgi:hypothetical protein
VNEADVSIISRDIAPQSHPLLMPALQSFDTASAVSISLCASTRHAVEAHWVLQPVLKII